MPDDFANSKTAREFGSCWSVCFGVCLAGCCCCCCCKGFLASSGAQCGSSDVSCCGIAALARAALRVPRRAALACSSSVRVPACAATAAAAARRRAPPAKSSGAFCELSPLRTDGARCCCCCSFALRARLLCVDAAAALAAAVEGAAASLLARRPLDLRPTPPPSFSRAARCDGGRGCGLCAERLAMPASLSDARSPKEEEAEEEEEEFSERRSIVACAACSPRWSRIEVTAPPSRKCASFCCPPSIRKSSWLDECRRASCLTTPPPPPARLSGGSSSKRATSLPLAASISSGSWVLEMSRLSLLLLLLPLSLLPSCDFCLLIATRAFQKRYSERLQSIKCSSDWVFSSQSLAHSSYEIAITFFKAFR